MGVRASASKQSISAPPIDRRRPSRHVNSDTRASRTGVRSDHDIRRIAALEADLQAANRVKEESFAAIAHELRQPLNACLGAVAMMKIRQNRETGERARAVLERQLTQMTRLIEDLLDTNQVAQGAVRLRKLHVDLRDAVQRACESSQPVFDSRRHTCKVVLPDAPVIVDGDATRLQQILTNLLGNAAKYTDPGGQIIVTVSRDPDTARVSVRDNGQGIPNNVQARIFDLFTRATTDGGGFGIGLAIVRRLVEAHGGSVAVVSDGVGHGSEFLITMPRIPA